MIKLITLLAFGLIGWSFWEGYKGVSLLIFIYFVIFATFLLKDFLKDKDLKFILTFLEKRIVFVIVFYISLTTTLFSVVGSIYPSFFKDFNGNTFMAILNSFNESSHIVFVMFLPLLFISYVIDILKTKLSTFILRDGKLIDSNTNAENIVLRHKTFETLINNIEDVNKLAEIATETGTEFGKLLNADSKIKNFEDFIDKWAKTDTNAGFINEITFTGSGDKEKEVKTELSFAKKILESSNKNYNSDNKEKICIFFENYVKGIILGAYNDKVDNVKLKSNYCKDCKDNNSCIFSVCFVNN